MHKPHLDPQVEKLLRTMEAQGVPPLESLSPQEARRLNVERKQQIGGEPEPVAKVIDHQIEGPGGDIPIRIYSPKDDTPSPAFIYYHGGGWVIGDLFTHDALCRSLCNTSECMVVSVDYRLAPEHPFPAAVEDAVSAAQWVSTEIQHFSGDPGRLAIGGDSAGGTLATVAAAKLKNDSDFNCACQILIYPVMDLSSLETNSYNKFAEGYFLTKASMAWFRDHYLANEEDAHNPDASPLLREDLSGLPPALVITAEFDPLLDEGEAYAARLKAAGVPVKLKRYSGMVHGFLSMATEVDRAHDAIKECADTLKSAFTNV